MVDGIGRGKPCGQTKVDLGALRIPKASEVLANELKDRVLRRLPVGAVLPTERELISSLGVSRMTVREALRILEAEGLISVRPGRKGGPVVQRPGDRGIAKSLAVSLYFEGATFADLLETRRFLEPLCARLAAERATPDDLQAMRESNTRYRGLLHDHEACILENLTFHMLIANASHNTVIRLLVNSLKNLVYQCTADLGLSMELREAVLEVHERIVDAIEERNADLAQRRMEKHLLANEEVFNRRYGDPACMQFGSDRGELYLMRSD